MIKTFTAGPQAAVANVFALYAEFVVEGTYYQADGTEALVKWLVMPVPPELVDGTIVQPNDERVIIAAGDMDAVDRPKPGDYLVQTDNGLRRDVVTAHLDVTGTYWALVGRRVL